MLNRIKDDKDDRWYCKEGTIGPDDYIGVTSVLDIAVPKQLKKYFVNNSAAKQTKRLQETGDLGTAIHNEIEANLNDTTIAEPRLDCIPAMKAWKTWRASNEIKTIQTETIVWSDKLGYAGTFDFIANINGVKYLGDIKTGFFSVKAGWQMMAYKLAAIEMGILEPETKLVGVQVPRDGTEVKTYFYEHEDWLKDSWLSCFQLWKALNFTNLNKSNWKYLKNKVFEG